jgi:hypothetical protein
MIMPQAYESLREKFMAISDDGIMKAETIIRASGGTVRNGVIIPAQKVNLKSHTRGDIMDAIDYLVEEWDYCVNC